MSSSKSRKKRRTHGMEMLLEQLDSEYGQPPPEKRSRTTGATSSKSSSLTQKDEEDTGEPLSATSDQSTQGKRQGNAQKEGAVLHGILHRYWKAVSSKTKFEEILRRLSKPWQLDNAQSLSVPSDIQRQLQSVNKFRFRGHPKQLLNELRKAHIPDDVIRTLHESWMEYARKTLKEVIANASTTGTTEGVVSQDMKAKLFGDVTARIDLSFALITIKDSPGCRAYENKSAFILVETKECLIVSLKETGKVAMLLKRSLKQLQLHLPDNVCAVCTGRRFWEQRQKLWT